MTYPIPAASRRTRSARAALVATLLAPLAALAQAPPWVGLSHEGAQLLLEEVQGGHGPGRDDLFGLALAAGDFNGDGHDDLAAAAPFEDCTVGINCGLVQVRFGWHEGALGAVVTLDPAAPGAPDPSLPGDIYGRSLAVGDFNRDGRDDLVVGVPGNDTTNPNDGAVQIHYGLAGDLGSIQPVAQHMLHQDSPGIPGASRRDEYFGHALAAGDFDGDGHDDLAIGAPYDRSPANDNFEGNVVVTHGHLGGLVPADGFEMRQGLQGLPDQPEYGDAFGKALAAGDFNGDGYDDLAIGAPGEDGIGAVLVVYGSPNSLIFANHWFFSQWDLNQTTNFEGGFGEALVVGDFDGDGYDDLAVGSPGYDGATPAHVDMGIVALVYGGAAGLGVAGHEFLWEDRLLGVGNSEAGDQFGIALAAADFDGDGVDDLAIGARFEDGIAIDSGSVTVLPGHRQRVIGLSRQLRASPVPHLYLVPDNAGDSSHYGAALAAGDFDGNGYADLAIGAPLRNGPGDPVDAGAVAVIYAREQSLFSNGFQFVPGS